MQWFKKFFYTHSNQCIVTFILAAVYISFEHDYLMLANFQVRNKQGKDLSSYESIWLLLGVIFLFFVCQPVVNKKTARHVTKSITKSVALVADEQVQ